MPISELQAIGSALGELGVALDAAEVQRRALSRQVLTLQEDERQRIARELHDEFGQRLTALRANAAWLARHVSHDAKAAQVVHEMSVQCAKLQTEIRALLDRLQPAVLDAGSPASLLKLQTLLDELVQAWNATPAVGVRFTLELRAVGPHGAPLPWPDAAQADALALPQALVLALYRISQEALTNVARHARASTASLQLTLSQVADEPMLQWQVSDDGAGLGSLQVALQRGNGLAGMRQRVWAFGGDLACEDAARGLRLSARFALAPVG
jgi:two-component system sensor histidine kinase UhpB